MQEARDIIAGILRREGWPTYTNHPADRGGPTKGGITLSAFRDYCGNQALRAEDLQAVTEAQARVFYMYKYITDPRFHRIEDARLLALVVDCGVHHGPRAATKWVQRAVGMRQDGIFGDMTTAAVNGSSAQKVYLLVLSYRIRLFGYLIGRDPELKRAQDAGFRLQARWAGGWNNRAAEFIEALTQHSEEKEIAA